MSAATFWMWTTKKILNMLQTHVKMPLVNKHTPKSTAGCVTAERASKNCCFGKVPSGCATHVAGICPVLSSQAGNLYLGTRGCQGLTTEVPAGQILSNTSPRQALRRSEQDRKSWRYQEN
eukprot:4812807-Amphidinium_carterae.1